MKLRLIATSAFGLEGVVEREITDLGYEDVALENGRVLFTGDELAICRTNLWLRSADRVLVQVGVFPAETFDQLFEGCKALPWSSWLPADASFPVTGRSVKSALHSVPDCQAIVKKAIVESLKRSYEFERFPETGPTFPVHVSLLDNVATIALDTSGQGLHKRGYREAAGPAPLKETLAAGMLALSRWTSNRPLLDPFCGSGTIPIEAVLMGCNIAPGINRGFASEDWPIIGGERWKEARDEVQSLAKPNEPLEVSGSDIEPSAISLSLEHSRLANVRHKIRFERKAIRDVRPLGKYGCLVSNPPYGERSGTQRAAEQAYRDLRAALAYTSTWSVFIITANKQFEKIFGRSADKRRRLYNGQLECIYYQFFGELPPRGSTLADIASAPVRREQPRQVRRPYAPKTTAQPTETPCAMREKDEPKRPREMPIIH